MPCAFRGARDAAICGLESKDAIKRRIDEAAKYVPLENLFRSPQCGFASTHYGNKIASRYPTPQAGARRRGRE
jgi:methionine synthase II (cobalamin-independent)